jgi:hypothetical protein
MATELIGPGDFGPQAQVETFDSQSVGNSAGTLVLDGVTYDEGGGYQILQADPLNYLGISGRCLGTYVDNSDFFITLGTPAYLVGGYLGGGFVASQTTVVYYDTNNVLLGVSNPIPLTKINDAPAFFGFGSLTDPIKFIEIAPNSAGITTLDNFTFQTIPPDTDTNEQNALSLTVNGAGPIGAAIASAVPFTVGGVEADDSGKVTFGDGNPADDVVISIVNGAPVASTANLSGLTDGPITATLHVESDAAGNSFTDVVTTATLDQDTNDRPTLTLAGLTGGNAVEGTAVLATVAADDLPSQGVAYVWQVSHDGGTTWTPIPSATSNSYIPGEIDQGGEVQVQASFIDVAGNSESAIAIVPNVVESSPTLSVSISGIGREGQMLTAVAVSNDSDATIKYRWQAFIGGSWTKIGTRSTYVVTEATEGEKLRVVATSTDSDGGATKATSAATATVTDMAAQLLIANKALTLPKGGSVGMGLSVSLPGEEDTVTVQISGLKGYESVTNNFDHQTFSGGNGAITLTAAQVNSGLTLNSTYRGTGQPVNTLTLMASEISYGKTVKSASQTITVTDPPTVLLTQAMASFGAGGSGGSDIGFMPPPSQTGAPPTLMPPGH